MIPCLDVSHLPSSTSFYSAILQPLGLRYISWSDSHDSGDNNADDYDHGHETALIPISASSLPAAVVGFGRSSDSSSPPSPVLQIREVANPLRLSRVVLSAPSLDTLASFRSSALRADPSAVIRGGNPQPHSSDTRRSSIKAEVVDLDGNIMEVVYQPPSEYPDRYRGSTVRRTQSTSDEVTRILDWNYDVARTSPPQSSAGSTISVKRSPATTVARRQLLEDADPYVLRRSVTTSTYESIPRQTSASAGLVAAGILGLGVGSVLTYNMLKNDRARAPVQELDAPVFQRRSTFPERLPSEGSGRYIEVERTVERIRYPEEYLMVGSTRPAPQYVARYSQAGSVMSREADDAYDRRSRHSSRYSSGRGSSVRTRSEAATTRAPLLITDGEHQSHVSSRKMPPSRSGHHPISGAEGDKYSSTRSQRSSTTVRPPAPPTVLPDLAIRSRAPSRHNPKLPTEGPVRMPPNSSRTASYVSARIAPLPRGVRPSVHTLYDDDNDSISPSDSISCVGSRRRARGYY